MHTNTPQRTETLTSSASPTPVGEASHSDGGGLSDSSSPSSPLPPSPMLGGLMGEGRPPKPAEGSTISSPPPSTPSQSSLASPVLTEDYAPFGACLVLI